MRVWAFGAALTLAAGLAGCGARTPPPAPRPVVFVSKPLKTRLVDWDDYVGRFEAVNSVDVRPRVTGYLQSVGFRDGQMVRKGQVLFVIDPRPYQAALAQARGQAAHAQSALSHATVELTRAQSLLAAHAISEQDYQTRLATQQQAAADLQAAQAQVQAAALNVQFTKVTAPMTGRASDRRVAPGNLVTQDSTVLTNITDLDPIRFTFDAAESFYLKYQQQARTGARPESRYHANPVEIRLQDQPNYVIKGHMDFVDNAEDPNSGTIRGRAIVPNPNLTLTPGMFGHLRLLGSGSYEGLLVPDTAVATQQSDQIVLVVAPNGHVQQRKITAGPLVDGLRAIRAGLGADEMVIVDGAERARVGMQVETRPGRIAPPDPGASPTPADLAPPAAAATFADPHG